MTYDLTILTATVGRPNLERLIASIDAQKWSGRYIHLLLWDDYRLEGARDPFDYEDENRYSIVRRSEGRQPGSSPAGPVYAMGMMAAFTPWITMADDDVWWESDHLEKMMNALNGNNWASTLRKIWSPTTGEFIGIDRFESVGDDMTRNVPYEMCDSNTMIFRRELGVHAAPRFRETQEYNGDRILYSFFKEYGGKRGRVGYATINQTCPAHLEDFFQQNCLANDTL